MKNLYVVWPKQASGQNQPELGNCIMFWIPWIVRVKAHWKSMTVVLFVAVRTAQETKEMSPCHAWQNNLGKKKGHLK